MCYDTRLSYPTREGIITSTYSRHAHRHTTNRYYLLMLSDMMTRQSSPWLPWKLCFPLCFLEKSFDLLLKCVCVCVYISNEHVT